MQKSDLFNLNYYTMVDLTGSKGEICYRLSLEKSVKEGPRFKLEQWRGPFNTEETEEQKESTYFPYSDEGLEEIAAFINELDAPALHGNLFEAYMKQRAKGEEE